VSLESKATTCLPNKTNGGAGKQGKSARGTGASHFLSVCLRGLSRRDCVLQPKGCPPSAVAPKSASLYGALLRRTGEERATPGSVPSGQSTLKGLKHRHRSEQILASSPLGLIRAGTFSQGSSFLATLGLWAGIPLGFALLRPRFADAYKEQGKPDALQTLRDIPVQGLARQAFGVRGACSRFDPFSFSFRVDRGRFARPILFEVSRSCMLPGEQESKQNTQGHDDEEQKYQNAPQRFSFRLPHRFPPEIALGKDAFKWGSRRVRSQWSAAVLAKIRPGRVVLET